MEEIKTGVFKIINNIPIYIIGDIHGDYQCLIHCLVDLCGCVSIKSIEQNDEFGEKQREILEWDKDNNSVVIFCGDLIHRKRFQNNVLDDECSDIFIIETLFRLKKSAKKFGGDIIIVSGNHEIMTIIDPTDSTYTSDKNMPINKKYFSQSTFVNNYISNTYAWIKLNDIMIAHGGLCSEYLKFLDKENELKNKHNIIGGYKGVINSTLHIMSSYNVMIGGNLYEYGDDIIEFVNDKYRSFFTDYSSNKSKTDPIGYKLFVEYDFSNKHKHNVFWCREWGYSGINCDNFNKTVEKIGCNKMIVAHCPQFLSEDKSKMINFECEDTSDLTDTKIKKFKVARVDLGMSRSFEYNKPDEFVKFLSYNHNRKMSVLKLSWDKKNANYYFNYESVKSEKISCIQYLLIKYGLTKEEWIEKNIQSNWLGFDYIDGVLMDIKKNINVGIAEKCNYTYGSSNSSNPVNVMMCLLYPLYFNKPNLKSANKFTNLIK
jgi:hypothetical protein